MLLRRRQEIVSFKGMAMRFCLSENKRKNKRKMAHLPCVCRGEWCLPSCTCPPPWCSHANQLWKLKYNFEGVTSTTSSFARIVWMYQACLVRIYFIVITLNFPSQQMHSLQKPLPTPQFSCRGVSLAGKGPGTSSRACRHSPPRRRRARHRAGGCGPAWRPSGTWGHIGTGLWREELFLRINWKFNFKFILFKSQDFFHPFRDKMFIYIYLSVIKLIATHTFAPSTIIINY